MLKDSGAIREFRTGAVRDIAEGKGRCDLLPLEIIAKLLKDDRVLNWLHRYVRFGGNLTLYNAIETFVETHPHWNNMETAILEVSKQYEEGAKKYSERNWEKGIPVHCFIDSATRHYLKWRRGDDDEPHDRAFVWNILGAIWTHHYKPELIDLPFAEKEDEQ